MGIEGIINKIEADTDARIAEIRTEADNAISKIEAELAEYKSKKMSEAENNAKNEAKRRFDQVLAREEARLRMELLRIKRELIDEAFEMGRQAILKLPAERLRERYAEMAASFGETEGELLFGKLEECLHSEEFRDILTKKLPNSSFKTSVSDDFDRGLMLVAGRIRYDARFTRLFDELKERITDEVAAALFGERGEK